MFEEAFPQYLVMGMSYEQYWEGPPSLAVFYRKAFKLRKELENEQAWLQGLYVYDAFAVCLANVFRKKGAKTQSYLEKPIDIFPLTEREKKRREAEENEKMRKVMEEMIQRQKRRKKQKAKQGD